MSKSKNNQPSVRKGRPQSAFKSQINRKMKRIHKSSGLDAVYNWCEKNLIKGQYFGREGRGISPVPYSTKEALKVCGYGDSFIKSYEAVRTAMEREEARA